MEQGTFKVLIIEDDAEIRAYFEHAILTCFAEKVSFALAASLTEAEEKFTTLIKQGLDIIFIDACLHSTQPNSMPLIRLMVRNFNGPLFAMSCNKEFIVPLLQAGCNRSCLKRDLPRVIGSYLNA